MIQVQTSCNSNKQDLIFTHIPAYLTSTFFFFFGLF